MKPWVVGVGLLCLLAGCSTGGTAPVPTATSATPTTTATPDRAALEAQLAAAQGRLRDIIGKACTDRVLPRLKSPGSATFMDVVVTPDPVASSTKFSVVGKVRSLNVMGVPLDAGFGCKIVATAGSDTLDITLQGPYEL